LVPIAVVVAGATVLVKVAIGQTGLSVSAWDICVVARFVVIARPQAVRVLSVYQAISVVVLAVATGVQEFLTVGDVALVGVPAPVALRRAVECRGWIGALAAVVRRGGVRLQSAVAGGAIPNGAI
jgi:hypothetical protein